MASWVAVQGAAKEDVFDTLGVEPTDQAVVPGERGFRFSFCERPDGWLVIFSSDFEWGSPARACDLSRFGPAVGLQFEDKVEMTATACGARDGSELWRVHHHNDPIWRLDVSGDPPAELAEIREAAFREQEEDGGEDSDVDFIHEIPLDLAKAACGFRADEDNDPFFRLVAPGERCDPPRAVEKGGFLKRLFGLR